MGHVLQRHHLAVPGLRRSERVRKPVNADPTPEIRPALPAPRHHLIGWLTPETDSLRLSFIQFMVCTAASLVTAVAIETAGVADVAAAALPIIYGGVLSVGVADTLQVVAQRHAHPAILLGL